MKRICPSGGGECECQEEGMCAVRARPSTAPNADRIDKLEDAVALLADCLNQIAMGVETLSQRTAVRTPQPYANGVFEQARKVRNRIPHLIEDS